MKYPEQLADEGRGERWRLAGDEIVSNVHLRKDCKRNKCTLHNAVDPHMTTFRLHYRHDRGIFERICEHGVGHIDPNTYLPHDDSGIHGCDGCCWRGPKDCGDGEENHGHNCQCE